MKWDWYVFFAFSWEAKVGKRYRNTQLLRVDDVGVTAQRPPPGDPGSPTHPPKPFLWCWSQHNLPNPQHDVKCTRRLGSQCLPSAMQHPMPLPCPCPDSAEEQEEKKKKKEEKKKIAKLIFFIAEAQIAFQLLQADFKTQLLLP